MLVFLAAGTLVNGAHFAVWPFITEYYLALITSKLLIAFSLATYVYAMSFSIQSGKPSVPAYRELAIGGNTENEFYNWFVGRELNPVI